MTIEPTGEPIATGRAADIFDLGDGTVLRRYRSEFDCSPEGRLMRWLAERGIPVPAVHHADGRDIVMDRVDGPTMLDDLERRPWRLPAHARLLADLQRQINGCLAPDWMRAAGPGDRVLHLDLHPMNVMVPPAGPVVIDWTNARSGSPELDAATSYVLMSAFEASGARDRVAQRVMVAAFRLARGRRLVGAGLAEAVTRRLADPNTTDGERAALRRIGARR